MNKYVLICITNSDRINAPFHDKTIRFGKWCCWI